MARPTRAVVVGSFLTLLALSVPTAYGAAVPGLSRASGVDVAVVGQLVTVHAVGAAAGLFGWFVLSRRLATARLLVGAVGLLLLGALAIALNPLSARVPTAGLAFPALVAAVAVVGFAFGLGMVATNTVLANTSGSSGVLNAANGMYGIGAVVLPFVVGIADLRTATLVVASLAVPTVLSLRSVPDLSGELRASRRRIVEARAGAGAGPAAVSGQRVGERSFLSRLWHGSGSRPWVWMSGVAIGVEAGTGAWAATHLVGLGIDEARAASAVSGFFVTFTVARFAMAWIGDRVAPRVVVVGANLLAMTAALLAAVVPLPSYAWALVGFGVGPVFGTSLAWLTQAVGDPDGARRMTVGGAVGAILLLGGIGVLVGALGPQAIPWAIAFLAVTTAGLAATLPAVDDQRPGLLGAATSANH